MMREGNRVFVHCDAGTGFPIVLLVVMALFSGLSGCQLTSDFPFKSTLEAIASREDQRVAADEIYPYFDYENREVRYRAALALARLRNADAVDFIVERLDREREAWVTETLLFALGQIGSAEGKEAALKFFASGSDRVRAAAVEAAGRFRDPSVTPRLLDRLANDSSPYVRAEACIALFRLGAIRYEIEPELTLEMRKRRNDTLMNALVEDPSADVRWRAAYAMAAIADPAFLEAFRNALTDQEDLWVRTFAARGLKTISGQDDRERQETKEVLIAAAKEAARNEEWNVVVEAIGALGNYNDDLEIAALLINFLLPETSTSFHIRAAAARTLGRFKNQESIHRAVVGATRDPSRTVVGEAIVALGALKGTGNHLGKTAESPDRYIRLKTVEGAALMKLDGLDLLLELAEDDSVRVRCAALEALADPVYLDYRVDIVALARRAVTIDDLSLRYTGAELLLNLGDREALDLLKTAYYDSIEMEMAEARLKIVEAVAALGGDEDIEFFEDAVEDEDFDVRNTAAKTLSALGQLSHVEPRTFKRQVIPEVGRDYLDGSPNPVAHFYTTKGDFWIELFKEDAPVHVKNFLDLARARRYNKLTFHRVVSNFVVQGLDPRGDGWGFNNTRLRDEINRHKYLRGFVGMPNSGPDTGGCQIFITHCPTPHLDGDYTIMGRVVSGMEVVDTLEVGDRVLYVTVK